MAETATAPPPEVGGEPALPADDPWAGRDALIHRLQREMAGFEIKRPDPAVTRPDLAHGWLLPALLRFDGVTWGRWAYWAPLDAPPSPALREAEAAVVEALTSPCPGRGAPTVDGTPVQLPLELR